MNKAKYLFVGIGIFTVVPLLQSCTKNHIYICNCTPTATALGYTSSYNFDTSLTTKDNDKGNACRNFGKVKQDNIWSAQVSIGCD